MFTSGALFGMGLVLAVMGVGEPPESAGALVTVAFPKPPRARRKRTVASLKAHYSRVAAMPSCVSGRGPVVLHHVPVVSPKSGQQVRKRGGARAAVVPLTREEHEYLHELGGERQFERALGLPANYLVSRACWLLSETVTGE